MKPVQNSDRTRSKGAVKRVVAIGDLTLEVERDGPWYVGQLREMPEVISQGLTFRELRSNIIDAYQLIQGRPERLPISPGSEPQTDPRQKRSRKVAKKK